MPPSLNVAQNVIDYVNRALLGITSGIALYVFIYSLTQSTGFSLAAFGLSIIISIFSPFSIAVVGSATFFSILLYTIFEVAVNVQHPPVELVYFLVLAIISLIFSFTIPAYVYIYSRTSGYLLVGIAVFYTSIALMALKLVDLAKSLGINMGNIPINFLSFYSAKIYIALWLALSIVGFSQPVRNESVKLRSIALTPLAYITPLTLVRFYYPYSSAFYFVLAGVIASYITLILIGSKNEYVRLSGGVTELVSAVTYGFGFYLPSLIPSPLLLVLGGIIGLVEVVSIEMYSRALASINQKRLIVEERSLVLEKIRNTIDGIEKIEDQLSLPLTSTDKKVIESLENAKAELEALPNELLKCKPTDAACIKAVGDRLTTIKKEVEVNVNNFLFGIISENNSVANFLKKYGILINQVEQPKMDIPFDQLQVYSKTVIESVLKNLNAAISTIKNLNAKLNDMLGMELTTKPLIGISIKNLPDLIDEGRLKEIDERLDRCLRAARSLTDILSDSRTKVEIASSISQASMLPISYEKVIDSYTTLRKLTTELKKDLEAMQKGLEELSTAIKTEQMKVRIDAVRESRGFLDSNAPMCENINKVFIYIPQLTDAYNMVRNKDNIETLAQLISAVLPTLESKEYVSVEELGISPDFLPYVLEILWSKGVNARAEKDKIVFLPS
mgnify:CR=1 FL=1